MQADLFLGFPKVLGGGRAFHDQGPVPEPAPSLNSVSVETVKLEMLRL